MATDDGPRAWAFLRRNPVYREEWRKTFERPVFEQAPFPVRVQSESDSQALAWGLLAWENPDVMNGAASPFWAEAPMVEAEWGTALPPLQAFLAKSGARLDGLRLADGSLILKIEKRERAAQIRIRAGMGMGLVLQLGFGPGQADEIGRFRDLYRLAFEPEQDARPSRRRFDQELLIVLDGRLAGKSWRETAVDLYGPESVAAEWHADSWMRARVRRRGDKARTLMENNYRHLVAGM